MIKDQKLMVKHYKTDLPPSDLEVGIYSKLKENYSKLEKDMILINIGCIPTTMGICLIINSSNGEINRPIYYITAFSAVSLLTGVVSLVEDMGAVSLVEDCLDSLKEGLDSLKESYNSYTNKSYLIK